MTSPNPSRLYCLIFGSFPALSLAEVEAILPFQTLSFPLCVKGDVRGFGEEGFQVRGVTSNAIILEGPTDEVMLGLFDRLGGAVRLVSIVFQNLSIKAIPAHLTKCLDSIVSPRPVFGMTVVGDGHGGITPSMIQRWGLELKKEFRVSGRSSRLVFDKSLTLSAAQVKKNQILEKGAEFVLIGTPPHRTPLHPPLRKGGKRGFERGGEVELWSIGTTLAIQDVDEWAQRDMNRPRRNARRGMLPPKLARVMVNLAKLPITNYPATAGPRLGGGQLPTVLDPFCGSGTVLMEALQLGHSVIGSDVSAEAVEDTKQNLEWLEQSSLRGRPCRPWQSSGGDRVAAARDDGAVKLFVSDVRRLSAKLPPLSVDAIVTEPDLGPPQGALLTSPKEIERTRSELSRLYLQSFEVFAKLLKPGGRVVISLPVWRVGGSPSPLRKGEVRRGSLVYAIKDLNTIKGFKIVNPLPTKLQIIPPQWDPALAVANYPATVGPRLGGGKLLNSERASLLYGRPEQFVWREILILEL